MCYWCPTRECPGEFMALNHNTAHLYMLLVQILLLLNFCLICTLFKACGTYVAFKWKQRYCTSSFVFKIVFKVIPFVFLILFAYVHVQHYYQNGSRSHGFVKITKNITLLKQKITTHACTFGLLSSLLLLFCLLCVCLLCPWHHSFHKCSFLNFTVSH